MQLLHSLQAYANRGNKSKTRAFQLTLFLDNIVCVISEVHYIEGLFYYDFCKHKIACQTKRKYSVQQL